MYTKIICGSGNNDVGEIKLLAGVYAACGVQMFDTSPSMLKILQKSLLEKGFELCNFKFCISVTSAGDAHGAKAQIIKERCKGCGKCSDICPRGGVHNCIGCLCCKDVCKFGALVFDYTGIDWDELKRIVLSEKVDVVELHASIGDKDVIINDLKTLCGFFKGEISVCISQEYFKGEKLVELLRELREIAKNNADFAIQADGKAMSGSDNEFETTKPCLELGKYLSENGFKVILSGGVNGKTRELVDFPCEGLAFGTYARLLVKNLEYNEALEAAKTITRGEMQTRTGRGNCAKHN